MNQKHKRILFVENKPVKIRAIVRALAEGGYSPEIVQLERAYSELKTRWWPLAVVDLRLVDDEDDEDFSGLELVNKTDPNITKLILTTYPSYQAAVKALQTYPGTSPPAVDFLSKLDPLDQVVERIVSAFEEGTKINWQLEVNFDGPLTFLCMADWLHQEWPQDVLEGQTVIESAEELADLWAKLFTRQTQLTVFPCSQGRGHALLSTVKPYGMGTEHLVVVKCGWRSDVERENQSYDTFVAPFVGHASTKKDGFAKTLHFAAIAYSLAGDSLVQPERFTDFYRTGDAAEVKTAIQDLFGRVCAPWYALPTKPSSTKLDGAFRQSMGLEGKEERLRDLLSELAKNANALGELQANPDEENPSFTFSDGLKIDFKQIHKWVYHTGRVSALKDVRQAFLLSATHGDLNGSNILVDVDGRTWLIDFGSTGYGYRLRDFAELESVIALDLKGWANLSAQARFEDLVFCQNEWNTGLGLPDNWRSLLGEDRQLCKAIEIIQEMRRLAGLWQEDGGLLQRYYLALLFEAVLRLVSEGSDSPAQPAPLWRRAHALLRVAKIVRTLS